MERLVWDREGLKVASVGVFVDLLHVFPLFEIAFECDVKWLVSELGKLSGSSEPLLCSLELMCNRGTCWEELIGVMESCPQEYGR